VDSPGTAIDLRLAVYMRVLVLVLEGGFLEATVTADLPLGIVIDLPRGPEPDPLLSHRAQDPLPDLGPDPHIVAANLLAGTLGTALPLEPVEVVMELGRDVGEEEARATAATARGATVGLGAVLVGSGAEAVVGAVAGAGAEREGLGHEGARKTAWSRQKNVYVMLQVTDSYLSQSVSHSSFFNNNSLPKIFLTRECRLGGFEGFPPIFDFFL